MTSYKVLLIDPNKESRQFLCQDLQDDGYEVSSHQFGLQALQECRQSEFNLILLERSLDDIDSLQLCQQILATESNLDAVIMIISSWEDQYERAKALKLGAADYITKPFHYPDLSRRLKKALTKTN
jgi:DNA-binding response OmpR family regulator